MVFSKAFLGLTVTGCGKKLCKAQEHPPAAFSERVLKNKQARLRRCSGEGRREWLERKGITAVNYQRRPGGGCQSWCDGNNGMMGVSQQWKQ